MNITEALGKAHSQGMTISLPEWGGYWYFNERGDLVNTDGSSVEPHRIAVYAERLDFDCHDIPEEPVSEDLGEYINELSKQFPEVSFAKLSRIAVRGAKWQEAKNQEIIETAIHHAYHNGRLEMKEQMTGDTVDAQCFGFQGAALFSFRLPADNYLVGSKVKVIVIKED